MTVTETEEGTPEKPWRAIAAKALTMWMMDSKSSLVLRAFPSGTEKDRARTTFELVERMEFVFQLVYAKGFNDGHEAGRKGEGLP
jgi:hypothetical protein